MTHSSKRTSIRLGIQVLGEYQYVKYLDENNRTIVEAKRAGEPQVDFEYSTSATETPLINAQNIVFKLLCLGVPHLWCLTSCIPKLLRQSSIYIGVGIVHVMPGDEERKPLTVERTAAVSDGGRHNVM